MDEKRTPPRLREGIQITPFDTSALEPRFLVQLPEGGRFQVSARLSQLIQALAGNRSPEVVCAELTTAWGQKVTPEDLQAIADRYLRPYGLLTDEEAAEHAVASPGPLLVRLPLFSPRLLSPLTRIGQYLFMPPAVGVILLVSLAVRYAIYSRVPSPAGNLVSSFWAAAAFVLLSILCHELGHVSACRHYSCTHGEIGIGVYAIFPVFYTDVSDTWRLSRRQRMVVDVAGIYFQMAFALVLYAFYLVAGWPSALTALKLTDGMMLVALNPIFRFDGYWLFSDLIGVPNLRRRAGDTIGFAVRRLIRRAASRRPALLRLPAAEMALLTVYAFVSNALLLYFFGSLLFFYLPGAVAGYPHLLARSWELLRTGITRHDLTLAASALRQPFTSTLILAMLALMIWRGRRLFTGSFVALKRWMGARQTKA
jgi:putative peptide zinc metalloprotease protein